MGADLLNDCMTSSSCRRSSPSECIEVSREELMYDEQHVRPSSRTFCSRQDDGYPSRGRTSNQRRRSEPLEKPTLVDGSSPPRDDAPRDSSDAGVKILSSETEKIPSPAPPDDPDKIGNDCSNPTVEAIP